MIKQFFGFVTLAFLSFMFFNITVSAKEVKKEPITNTAINLQGVSDSFTYNYYLAEDAQKGNNQLVLDVEHSSLLISPSSLTIRVDGENQKTVKLDGNKVKTTVQLDLKGKALKKGAHEITIVFYGIIKQGVCVENNTSGNWLRINPASYLQIQGDVTAGELMLQDYPSKFTSFQSKTDVVIPDDADVNTMDAALKIVSYLKKQAANQNQIALVKEKDFENRQTNKIIVGVMKDFKTEPVQNILKRMNVKTTDNTIQLQTAQEKIKKANRNILVVTAVNTDDLDAKIEVVSNQEFVSQLSGKALAIGEQPKQPVRESGMVTFEQMGIQNLEISNVAYESGHYYYYLPQDFDEEKAITATLKLKKSSILDAKQAELVMEVNGVPHAITLKEIKQDEGFFEINVPIEKNALKNNHLLDIQFKLNGSNTNNPCTTNDQEKWLFISKESTLNFSTTDHDRQAVASLTSYPGIFTNTRQGTYIIIESTEKVALEDLNALYTSSALSASAPNYELKTVDAIQKEKLKGRHLIFVGEAGTLQKDLNKKSPLVMKDDKPDFAEDGFIKETIMRYATIQKNPWDDAYIALQFNREGSSQNQITPKFLRQIQNLSADASVAVQNKEQQTFTNRAQYSIEKQKEAAPKQSQSALKWSSVLMFIGLLAVIGVILYLVFKRSKKK
ncbi:cellulose biosynthesis cyclic di-GMP-binding regulatory protein BcsB [Kurthia gibsonii]|uniref:cellulose biosynthesis cyclic di-GMP-binding regulatory protein BcsB n=1 Tax=Kurthia TaxID=1649 RepID=UPI00254BD6DD|nr:cellulose biosynthesis cyclic di-GMP-binding regulatory protein BcsB [Kurthia sp. YJT4]WIL37328.1 cellulose biosynthesis cyclic di-GMP-binding regulatory protein BcsB [Kurthia sp. YJT4]